MGFFENIVGEIPPDPPTDKKFIVDENDPKSVSFAFVKVPIAAARFHFLVMGMSGTGKTMVLTFFIQSIASRFWRGGPGSRLVVLDVKGNMVEHLRGCGIKEPDAVIVDLHPYRIGSFWIDLANDLNSPTDAAYLASIIIPAEPKSNAPFFWKAPLAIVRAVILAFMEKHPGAWTLRDLVLTLRKKKRIKRLVRRSTNAHNIAREYLNDKRHLGGVLSSIQTNLASLDILAALWHKAPRDNRFSFKTFFASHSAAVVLGHDETKEPVLAPLTNMFLRFASNRVLARPDVGHGTAPDTWFILDEFRALKEMDAVPALQNLGRSKGVSVFMTIQSREGLVAKYENVGLTESAAEELIGNCSSKCIFRLTPKSATWAEAAFGTRRVFERSFTEGESRSRDGLTVSSSVSYSVQERSLLTASTFSGLPALDSGNVVAVTDVQGQVVVKRRRTSEVFDALQAPVGSAPSERPVADQFLEEWSREEEDHFCPSPSSSDDEDSSPEFPVMKPFKPK